MPYFLLFFGTVVGILSVNWGLLLVPPLIVVLVFVIYKIYIFRFAWLRWGILLCAGICLGSLLGLKLVAAKYILGEICQGYVLKEYVGSVSIRTDNCYGNDRNGAVFYVACSAKQCPNVYERATFNISSKSRLGRFAGKGKYISLATEDSLRIRSEYFALLRRGNALKVSYYGWLREKLPQEQSSLVTSMLFGDTELSRNLTEKMKAVGLLHIVAISGINITYLQSIVRSILKKFNRKIRTFIDVIILFALFFVVGEAVSLIRAIIMSFIGIFTKRVGIKASNWAFFLGLSIVLILDSSYLWDAGFQLVSGACVGIYIGGKLLGKYLKEGVLREFAQGIVVWGCVAPIQFVLFGGVTVIGVLLSFLLSPFVEALTVVGYVSVIAKFVPFLEGAASIVLGLVSSVILFVISLFHVQ